MSTEYGHLRVVHKRQRFEIPRISISYSRKQNGYDRTYIRSSEELYHLCMSIWDSETIDLYEEFKVIFFDRSLSVIGYRNLGRGGVSGVIVEIRHILVIALECNASSFVIVHNHPSGNLTPSRQDVSLTNKLQQGANLLDLKLQDHLILTSQGYYSFIDEGIIE